MDCSKCEFGISGMHSSRQKGFTLIELVTVITILGVLAAVAIPRFVNMQHEARVAKAQALHGAISSAANMMHSVARIRSGSDGNVSIEGVSMRNYYPAASADGIVRATTVTDTEIQYPAENVVYYLVAPASGVSNPLEGGCGVIYQEATEFEGPEISLLIESC